MTAPDTASCAPDPDQDPTATAGPSQTASAARSNDVPAGPDEAEDDDQAAEPSQGAEADDAGEPRAGEADEAEEDGEAEELPVSFPAGSAREVLPASVPVGAASQVLPPSIPVAEPGETAEGGQVAESGEAEVAEDAQAAEAAEDDQGTEAQAPEQAEAVKAPEQHQPAEPQPAVPAQPAGPQPAVLPLLVQPEVHAAGPVPQAQPSASATAASQGAAESRRGGRIVSRVALALFTVGVVLSVVPDLLGYLWPPLSLSVHFPFTQFIALRSALAVMAAVLAVVFVAIAAVRLVRREGGRRTSIVAALLVVAACAHTGIIVSRGLDRDMRITRTPPASDQAAQWDGNLTVFSFNTYQERADVVEVAVSVRTAGADVVVLPETDAAYGIDLAALLAEDGYTYTVFSSLDQETTGTAVTSDMGSGPAGPVATGPTASADPSSPAGRKQDTEATTVLVSTALGSYERAQRPEGLDVGNILLRPTGDGPAARPTILGVHTIAPVPGFQGQWRSSVEAAVGACAQADTTHLVAAGDFNASVDHAPMRDLGQCTDAASATGAAGLATWPATTGTPYVGAAIDHVLAASARWKPVSTQIADIKHSDHRALVVRLEAA